MRRSRCLPTRSGSPVTSDWRRRSRRWTAPRHSATRNARISPSPAVAAPSLALDLAAPVSRSGRSLRRRARHRASGAARRPTGAPPATPTRSSFAMRRRTRARPGRPAAARDQPCAVRGWPPTAARVLGANARRHDLEVSVYYVSSDSTGRRDWPSLRRKRLVGGTRPAFQDEELVGMKMSFGRSMPMKTILLVVLLTRRHRPGPGRCP